MMLDLIKREKPTLGTTTLLTYSSSKVIHSNESGLGYLTAMMYLAPNSISGFNVCQFASPGCTLACLYTSGHGQFEKTKKARIKRTNVFFLNREQFIKQLIKEILAHIRKARRMGLIPAVRLNATSDIPWERVQIKYDGQVYSKLDDINSPSTYQNLMELFPDVIFYDYTAFPWDKRNNLPGNYSLTFSRKETTTEQEMLDNLNNGRNVAVVMSDLNGKPLAQLPETYLDYPLVAGDITDQRILDTTPCVISLYPKKDAIKDDSGFVIRIG